MNSTTKKKLQVLVRYGAVPEVAYFDIETKETLTRGTRVVLRTQRGEEVGELLEDLVPASNGHGNMEAQSEQAVIRELNEDDNAVLASQNEKMKSDFSLWEKRIEDWKLELVLIDLEQTLDGKTTILYVLNDRGSDCTVLAIKAAASGLGNIQVQPVDENGDVRVLQSKGGCGSSDGSCGCS